MLTILSVNSSKDIQTYNNKMWRMLKTYATFVYFQCTSKRAVRFYFIGEEILR